MNLFVLDINPKKAAAFHSDKHCIKMILETAQMLSTAHHVLDKEAAPENIYRKCFVNHPCTIGVRKNSANYNWAFQLFVYLIKNYRKRYKKQHASSRLIPLLAALPKNIEKNKKLTPFALAMPEEFRIPDPVASYRNYYQKVKHKINVGKHSEVPHGYFLNKNNNALNIKKKNNLNYL